MVPKSGTFPRAILTAVTALVTAALLTSCSDGELVPDNPPASGGAASPGGSPGGAPGGGPATGPVDAGAAKADLGALTIGREGTMRGYTRAKFPHWSGQGEGCDTRDVVLKRDGQAVQASADCKITAGTWYSPYDDKTYTKPLELDIDHMVPLAAAWRSGADKWTDDKRSDFANDLTRPQLIAVSASTNRSKGDQDPSQWQPPNRRFWCKYAADWITVKKYWQLTVTEAERTKLGEMLATCG